MAEFILRDMLEKAHLSHRVRVASSATSREEIWGDVGNPVYPPAALELRRHGILSDGKRAVQLTAEDYNGYDILIVMDEKNRKNALRIVGADPEGKIKKLMDFTSEGGDVADPWYTDRFDIAYRDIRLGCEGVMAWLRARLEEK